MFNRLTRAIQAAGLNHQQIRQVQIAPEEEHKGWQYPCLAIWPAEHPFNTEVGGLSRYQFAIAVSDRHQDNSISALEAQSDCDQILLDIVASLQYMYKSSGIRWVVNDTIDPFYDTAPDKVAGVAVRIEAQVAWNSDFCRVPSNDYAFPDMNLTTLQILDGGDASFDLELEIADGGTA